MKRDFSRFSLFAAFAALVFFACYRFGFKIGFQHGLNIAQNEVPETNHVPTLPSVPPSPSASLTEAEKEDEIDLGLPSLHTYREQGTENPHQTPRVLIDFAHAIADHMEAAQNSKDEAKKLFSALEDCVQTAALPQARAICYVNEGRLTNEWREDQTLGFDTRYDKLRQELPEDVERLVQALE